MDTQKNKQNVETQDTTKPDNSTDTNNESVFSETVLSTTVDTPNDTMQSDAQNKTVGQSNSENFEAEFSHSAQESETIQKQDPQATSQEQRFCKHCGAALLPQQRFCPSCGKKTEKNNKGSTAKKFFLPILCIVIAAAVIIFFLIRGVQAKEISLNTDTVTIEVGETTELTYVIDPQDTKNKTVTWESSNNGIAKVKNGIITAENEGDCTITVRTSNGKTDTCKIIVEPAKPNLKKIFDQYCDDSFATLATDGSFLEIDTNPYDIDDYFDMDAYTAIENVNEALGLPESVLSKMNATRALDGRQSHTGDGIEVSWSYHPDNGLEVLYEVTE